MIVLSFFNYAPIMLLGNKSIHYIVKIITIFISLKGFFLKALKKKRCLISIEKIVTPIIQVNFFFRILHILKLTVKPAQ